MPTPLTIFRLGAALLSLCCTAACTSAAPHIFSEPFRPIDATVQNRAMGRGVNVLSSDPVWTTPAKVRFTPAHFSLIRSAGFRHVRIVVKAFDHIDSTGIIDPAWLNTLDSLITAALERDLIVILDEHDFNLCAKDADLCRRSLRVFWSQIAERYKEAPNRLVFELLNEPHGAITADVWNEMSAATLPLIRSSNPDRNVIIGPTNWNGLEALNALKLPENDRHIIATFHYYHPMAFTHQGAPWASKKIQLLSNVPWGSDGDLSLLNSEFDKVKAWSDAHSRPIYLGEFGAYDKAPMAYRVNWTAAVARNAEARGFSWAYWQFDSDFLLYDMEKQAFVEPILNALIPK